jgi:hypothetical protein
LLLRLEWLSLNITCSFHVAQYAGKADWANSM